MSHIQASFENHHDTSNIIFKFISSIILGASSSDLSTKSQISFLTSNTVIFVCGAKTDFNHFLNLSSIVLNNLIYLFIYNFFIVL